MHPFLASTKVKIFGGVLILLTASVQWAFLMYYGNAPLEETVADSFFSVLWLSCFGYFLWYMLDVSRSLLLDVLLTFVVIGFWLFITYASLYLCHFKDQAIYSFYLFASFSGYCGDFDLGYLTSMVQTMSNYGKQ